ncbi:MAG TPA: non-canonical purine NTP pyrophosphatase [Candidatus Limnocylindria bacterium]|nr:non-canonical purine NTP pyrophosphatase [Candidatus Limnocylindria bacterium]
MTRLLVATHNDGKLAEFRRLLAPLDAEVVSADDLGLDLDVPEPHDTYAENAADKAAAFCRASREITVADDSGIEVAALGWGPGARSARFASDDGLTGADLLLQQMAGTEDRRARMVCWLAVAEPAGDQTDAVAVELFAGVVEGEVARERRGVGGFGYDPVFELPDGRTTAELGEGEKDTLSHRGRAVQAAMPRLRELLSAHARMPATAEDA